MSSRQEEKAARRAEREAKEAEAARAAARSRRTQIGLGAIVAVAILAGSVFALTTSGGDKQGSGTVGRRTVDRKAAVPPLAQTDLTKAVALARCTVINPALEGSTHVSGPVTYKSNPPSSGNHNQVPAQDGIYDPGKEPAKENAVHSLEHGRVEIQYRPGTPATTIQQLGTVASEPLNGTAGYKVLVFENNTKMSYQVAAVAWGHILGCPTMNPRVFDALRAFRKQYTDKAPELVP